jgi:ArsR family transcriptional regulator
MMLAVSSPVSELKDQGLADLAKSLAHPARIRILRLLRVTPGCIGGDIVDAVGLAQSTVSEHLRILKASGVITGEISGPRVCYALNPEALSPLSDFIGSLELPANDACCIPEPKAAP